MPNEAALEWVKMNCDSGAALSTFPKEYGPEQEGNGAVYKTASGECIADYGQTVWL